MKKILGYLLALLLLAALFFAWRIVGSATSFSEPRKFLYIYTGAASEKAVMKTLQDSGFLKNPGIFNWLAGKLNVWERVRPGKYELEKGSSLLTLARKLRNGSQSPVKLIITKLRTRNDFAGLVGRKFESDSTAMMRFMLSNDSLQKFDLDTNTVMTAVFPNTYSLLWNSDPQRIFRKLNEQRTKFWSDERKQKAKNLGLTPEQVHVLASIVEEETLRNDEKPTVASVYLNRLKKGMNLGADPTVKFAVGDFSLKRILFGHINSTASSPYNTYKNKGLPPGPICTPSETTIDAVLNAAKTDYLFFCAKPNGNGYHAFASSDADHLKNAKAYQQWLDSLNIK
jgi:UPF0755 protein